MKPKIGPQSAQWTQNPNVRHKRHQNFVAHFSLEYDLQRALTFKNRLFHIDYLYVPGKTLEIFF